MKFFDDLLDNIDHYYKDKSKKDVLYSYVMASVGIGFAIYILTYEASEKIFMQAQKSRTALTQTLKTDEQYLREYSPDEVEFLRQTSDNLKVEFAEIKKSSDYIDYKISQLQPMIYNEAAWGNFIDSISSMAQANQVHINLLKNKFVTKSKDFGHVLDIELDFIASFHNTLMFMNALEKTPLVIDVHTMSIEAKDALTTHLKLAVWGINY